MELPASVIVESLSDWVIDASVFQHSDPIFRGVRVYTGLEDTLSENILYVCEPRLLYESDVRRFNQHYVIIKPCPFDYQPSNAIILSEKCNLRHITNILINLFLEMAEYAYEIKIASIANCGYDAFSKIAERAFPHCLVLMTDVTYNIIWKTREHVKPRYLNKIIERNFYSKSDLDTMADRGYFQDERKYFQPVLYDPDFTISGLPFMVRSYRSQKGALINATMSFVGCYFLDAPPTKRDYVLFQCLTDEIYRLMEANAIQDEVRLMEQTIIDDLISSSQTNPEFLYDRCAKIGLPYHGKFRIGLIMSDEANETKIAQMTNFLRTYCTVPYYGIFQYYNSVLILFQDWRYYDVRQKADFEEEWKNLIKTLLSCRTKMGISLGFDSIQDFGQAYVQALRSFRAGCQNRKNDVTYFYSEYYLLDMIAQYDSIIDLNRAYSRCLDQLNGGKSGTLDNLQLLYVYLSVERNVAHTARLVHMHRNGVLYRIEKIKDTLGLDLESSEVRLRLMISFKIMEYLGKVNLDVLPAPEDENQIFQIE